MQVRYSCLWGLSDESFWRFFFCLSYPPYDRGFRRKKWTAASNASLLNQNLQVCSLFRSEPDKDRLGELEAQLSAANEQLANLRDEVASQAVALAAVRSLNLAQSEEAEKAKKDQEDLLILLADQDSKIRNYKRMLRQHGEVVGRLIFQSHFPVQWSSLDCSFFFICLCIWFCFLFSTCCLWSCSRVSSRDVSLNIIPFVGLFFYFSAKICVVLIGFLVFFLRYLSLFLFTARFLRTTSMKTTTTSILPASMSWTRIPTICVNIWGKIFFQPRADENIRFFKEKKWSLVKIVHRWKYKKMFICHSKGDATRVFRSFLDHLFVSSLLVSEY